MFRGNISPPSSGDWSKPSSAYCLVHADFMHGLLFDPEDGDDIVLRSVGWLLLDYTALYPRR
jgi:hypothetical protein